MCVRCVCLCVCDMCGVSDCLGICVCLCVCGVCVSVLDHFCVYV